MGSKLSLRCWVTASVTTPAIKNILWGKRGIKYQKMVLSFFLQKWFTPGNIFSVCNRSIICRKKGIWIISSYCFWLKTGKLHLAPCFFFFRSFIEYTATLLMVNSQQLVLLGASQRTTSYKTIGLFRNFHQTTSLVFYEWC